MGAGDIPTKVSSIDGAIYAKHRGKELLGFARTSAVMLVKNKLYESTFWDIYHALYNLYY